MGKKNVFGVILAGGKGSRMGNTDKPKQFFNIGNKPIIIHTVEKFLISNQFDAIIVLVSKQWIKYTKDILKKYLISDENVFVVEGGAARNDTLNNAINYISSAYPVDDDTVVVTHDSVRPFVNNRIINENIIAAKKYGCCDTVINATDTIVSSEDGSFISDIPERNKMYRGQTPQSFKINTFLDIYKTLSEEEKQILTDACKIFTLKGEKVSLVQGEVTNFKITYAFDMKVAEAFIGK